MSVRPASMNKIILSWTDLRQIRNITSPCRAEEKIFEQFDQKQYIDTRMLVYSIEVLVK